MKTVVRTDTVVIARLDTVVVTDTLRPPEPAYFSYTVYYEIVDRKIAMNGGFEWLWEKTAQKTSLQSSDTTLLSLGSETLRSVGYTYDSHGNRTENREKIIEGLDMRIAGRNAKISYRIDSSLLTLDGRFDGFGLLQLASDFSRRRYLLGFLPLDFLFSSEKYTLFLRIEKLEAK